ncbi:MAG TPA: GyrI-like domain-containing protein [Fimbriimonas sp.]
MNETEPETFQVRLVEKPARRLILRRGHEATDYWGYCEECGCDVWGELQSLRGALDEPMGMWLPERFRKPETSEYVMAVEMPADYQGTVPDGMEILDLPPCHYLLFQGPPYSDEGMGEAIGKVWKAIESYQPEPAGWQWADESAPRFQYAPMPERGYIEGRPVKPVG